MKILRIMGNLGSLLHLMWLNLQILNLKLPGIPIYLALKTMIRAITVIMIGHMILLVINLNFI
ncbi:hypothetical protein ES703_88694 [subsurface metagenome]